MDTNRGRVLFVMVDSAGKYGDMYRQLFPDLRNATFFVSQPGEPHDCTHVLNVCTYDYMRPRELSSRYIFALSYQERCIRGEPYRSAVLCM